MDQASISQLPRTQAHTKMTGSTKALSTEPLQVKSDSKATIHQIKRWFEKAVPEPTDKNVHVQLGVHMEEVGEMMLTLQEAGSTFQVREELSFSTNVIEFIQRRLKAHSDGAEINLSEVNRIELLDALCDQIVTAVGVAHMLRMNIEGALQEVANSNDSKFGPDGNPIFNDQLKIMKGPAYFKPDLSPYI